LTGKEPVSSFKFTKNLVEVEKWEDIKDDEEEIKDVESK